MKNTQSRLLKQVLRFIDGSTLVLRGLSVLVRELGTLFKALSKTIPAATLVTLLILTSTGQITAMRAENASVVAKATT